MRSVLTIAGSDPSGGAGIQADLRVFTALGLAGLSVVSALTVQSSAGVQSVHPADPAVLEDQLTEILDDSDVAAVKIGMLGGRQQVEAVASALRDYEPPNIVLDPVLASTSGYPLLDLDAESALLRLLAPLCRLITPNLAEAHALTGLAVDGIDGMREVGIALCASGASAVLVKGGHLEGAPIDLLVTADGHATPFAGHRVDTPHTHGTGCFLSAAIASFLARGLDLHASVRAAKDLLTQALAHPVTAGRHRGYPDAFAAAGPPSPPITGGTIGHSVAQREAVIASEAKQSPAGSAGTNGDCFVAPLLAMTEVTPSPRYRGQPEARGRGAMSGLYVLTDSEIRPGRSHAEIVDAALKGGARIVQLREKRLPTPQLVDLARDLCERAHRQGALFIVNDRVDVAMASGADGVHLGPDDMHPADASRIMGLDAVIGVSVSTVDEARRVAEYASYLGVGAIFGSSTKDDAGPPVGTERIQEIKRAFPDHPIVAIGGISAANVAEVAAAGADSAAVVSAVVAADDMVASVRALIAGFQEGARRRP